MKIDVAKNAGFCFGVKRAVDLALSLDASDYMLGDIIHNGAVIKKINARGVKSIQSVDDLKQVPSDVAHKPKVIIRSHGATKAEYETIKKLGYDIIDATCPFVSKIHSIVADYSALGYDIAIIGSKTHPEVVATAGWSSTPVTIIADETDLELLKGKENVCVVCQTTFDDKIYNDLSQKILKMGLKKVEIFDTICYTTYKRRKEAVELSKRNDCILVVGDKKSSNTCELYELCKSVNSKTFFIDDLNALKSINFSRCNDVGIVAGASTPTELIMEVKTYMADKEFGKACDEEFINAVNNEKPTALKEGKLVKGSVIFADDTGIRVNVGGKTDALIPSDEVTDGEYDKSAYLAGSQIEAIVLKKRDEASGLALLSKRKADFMRRSDEEVNKIRNNETFEITIEKATKGGLLSSLGSYRVFIPASQIKLKYVQDLTKFEKQKMTVRALDIDDAERRIVASHRVILQEEKDERDKRAEIFWENVKPDVVVSGEVKRICPYGAFVSVDGIDCLAHIDHLSYSHNVKSPDEVLEVGKTYDFLVLRTDREKQRVSLGYRELQPSPYDKCMEKHPVGSIVQGKVVSVMPFGAFVEIEPGAEGLVHISEAANTFVKDINEVLHVGDEVTVKILSYDEEHNKINLSIKACLDIVKPAPKAPKKDESDVYSEKSDNNVLAGLLKDVGDGDKGDGDK